MSPKLTRKFPSEQKTTTPEGKREYQKLQMREYRERKKTGREKLISEIKRIQQGTETDYANFLKLEKFWVEGKVSRRVNKVLAETETCKKTYPQLSEWLDHVKDTIKLLENHAVLERGIWEDRMQEIKAKRKLWAYALSLLDKTAKKTPVNAET